MATVFLQRPPEVLPVLGAALPQSPGDFTMVFFSIRTGALHSREHSWFLSSSLQELHLLEAGYNLEGWEAATLGLWWWLFLSGVWRAQCVCLEKKVGDGVGCGDDFLSRYITPHTYKHLLSST